MEMESLRTPETTIRYRVDGPAGAPWLVLSNSLGTSAALWEPQMTAFTARHRVVRYEHRGHGGSAAPAGPYSLNNLGADLLRLLDALGAERASLCGLSLGGMVSMWVAAHAPQRVDRLVLCCTAAHLPPPDPWLQRAAAVRRGGTASLLPGLLQRWFTPGLPQRRPQVAQAVAEMLAAADPEGYAGCCEAIAGMDLTGALAAIAAPTLVIAGALDPVTPPAMGAGLQGRIASSSLVVLPDASHLANLEQPDRFAAAVVDHLVGPARERGMAVRRTVLGDAHVDRAEANRTPFTSPFQDFITRFAWGEVWTRPGLDRPTRSCITLAMLVALGRFDELPMHVRAALRNGLSREQVAEVLLQTAVYCGAPAANTAFAVAQRTLQELDGG
jgi:3-oxoadipate enol-lactonase/4-carboxymuconolactone decarboxylase